MHFGSSAFHYSAVYFWVQKKSYLPMMWTFSKCWESITNCPKETHLYLSGNEKHFPALLKTWFLSECHLLLVKLRKYGREMNRLLFIINLVSHQSRGQRGNLGSRLNRTVYANTPREALQADGRSLWRISS